MGRSTGRAVALGLAASVALGVLPGGQARVHAVSEDQRQIVERADLLYDALWVAQETVEGWRGEHIFEEGQAYRLPYAQPVQAGRYIGYGVSVEAFLQAAGEEGSEFYDRRSHYGDRDSTYYGTDCSAFVSWCWGIDRHTTYSIPKISAVLGMATEENIRSRLRLGDALNSSEAGHVVLVTGIGYDSHGNMVEVELTEQTPPQLTRSVYTPGALAEKYQERYQICRYEGDVPPAPEVSALSRCTAYPACGLVEISADTTVLDQPDDGAKGLYPMVAGAKATVTGLYKDPEGRLWYRVSEPEGYLPAEDTVYLQPVTDGMSLTGTMCPDAHVAGERFDVTGQIRAGHHRLVRVAAVVRRGFGPSGTVVTGASDAASANSYELMNSPVDEGTAFGTVPVGANTFEVYAEYESFRAEDGRICKSSGVVCLLSAPFVCVEEKVDRESCGHENWEGLPMDGSGESKLIWGCLRCGLVRIGEAGAVCEHQYTGRITTVPTGDREGLLTYTCRCGDSYTEVLPPVG